jgi:cbb3-type cytochrome oxidase maturation protein
VTVDALFWLVPLALALGGFFAMAFLWAVRSGQMEDLDDPPVRMLQEDDPHVRPPPRA